MRASSPRGLLACLTFLAATTSVDSSASAALRYRPPVVRQAAPLSRLRGGADGSSARAPGAKEGGADGEDEIVIPPHVRRVLLRVAAGVSLLIALGVVHLAKLLTTGINTALARAWARAGNPLELTPEVTHVQVLALLAMLIFATGVIRRLVTLDASPSPFAAPGAPRGAGAASAAAAAGKPKFPFFDQIAEKIGDIDVDKSMRARLRAQIRWYEPNATGVTFDDVGGCDEAVAEVRQLVDFLKAPERYYRLGARMPRGVLLEGPPGTGKTLLAKAVASEAGVAFAAVPAPAIGAQRFAGVSSMFVTELFRNASARAPCVLYIDELDSLGAARAAGAGDVSRDKADGLNTLLTAMDGFDTAVMPKQPAHGGARGDENGTAAGAGAAGAGAAGAAPPMPPAIVVLASTNRADVLDPALLRPGRFDRRVAFRLPDSAGREHVLRACARRRVLSAEARATLPTLALSTGGLSGAELDAIVNEAAIAAASRNASAVEPADLRVGLERATVGLPLAKPLPDAARAVTAVHEAGHTLVALATERWLDERRARAERRGPRRGGDELGLGALDAPPMRVERVTIVPHVGAASGASGGHTAFTLSDAKLDGALHTVQDVHARLAVCMGGRAAEAAVLGHGRVTSGAEADLAQAWQLASACVERLGMSRLGPVHVPPDGRSTAPSAAAVSREVERLVRVAAASARELVDANRALLDALTRALLERDSLTRAELDELIASAAPRGLSGLRALDRLDKAVAAAAETPRRAAEPTLGGSSAAAP